MNEKQYISSRKLALEIAQLAQTNELTPRAEVMRRKRIAKMVREWNRQAVGMEVRRG